MTWIFTKSHAKIVPILIANKDWKVLVYLICINKFTFSPYNFIGVSSHLGEELEDPVMTSGNMDEIR